MARNEGAAAMKTVRILGNAKTLASMPPTRPGVEVWLANDAKKYLANRRVLTGWTRWFNLHSREHQRQAYPTHVRWLREQLRAQPRPYYTQVLWGNMPGCVKFPRKTIQRAFATSQGPNRYFACTLAWQLALAIYERFDVIELWGYTFRDVQTGLYAFQRPCIFYWIALARARGVLVLEQAGVAALPHVAGDPDAYRGPVYGYDTKPETIRPVLGGPAKKICMRRSGSPKMAA
jgi:hypothetical protein